MKHPKARVLADRDHHLQLRGGWWHFVCEWRGRRIRRATRTTDAGLARKLRDTWMEEIWREGMLPEQPAVNAAVTVGEILDAFEAGPLDSSAAHRRRVCNIVRSIVRTVHPDRDPNAMDQAVLSEATVAGWRRARLAAAQAVEATEGQAAGARLKASANSLLNQAAALFSSDAVALFRERGLAVTVADGWRAACRARSFKVASARARWEAPAPAVVRAVLVGAGELLAAGAVQRPEDNATPAEDQRRNLALAVALMLGGGLRKGEVHQLRWDWISDAGADWSIAAPIATKDGSGRLNQRVQGWALDLCGVRSLRMESGPILGGHETERREMVFRRLSDWMRGLGWTAQKTAHGLRDLAISIVIAQTGSAWEGQGFARHSSVTVTESHYGHFARERWLMDVVKDVSSK